MCQLAAILADAVQDDDRVVEGVTNDHQQSGYHVEVNTEVLHTEEMPKLGIANPLAHRQHSQTNGNIEDDTDDGCHGIQERTESDPDVHQHSDAGKQHCQGRLRRKVACHRWRNAGDLFK